MHKKNNFKSITFHKIITGFVTALVLSLGLTCSKKSKDPKSVDVYFSPEGNCTEQIVNSIDSAKSTIFVQAYAFTSYKIAKALIEAKERGVKVKLIADYNQSKKTSSKMIKKLYDNNIEVMLDLVYKSFRSGCAHSKVIIIDKSIVITGSFNWTEAAENKNVENLLIIEGSKIVQSYMDAWHKRYKISKKYPHNI